MNPLEMVKLTPLMRLTSGRPEVVVGLIDGPVAITLPDFSDEFIREIHPFKELSSRCNQNNSPACVHGTFVAGILSAKRGACAPSICPHCTLLLCPIFSEAISEKESLPIAATEDLAIAIVKSIDAGARILNMSIALAQPSSRGRCELEEALDYAVQRGVIVVAAAGNQGMLGSSVITRHPWVIPVVACEGQGKPLSLSNLGSSIGRRGLSAPGEAITSLGAEGKPLKLSGTSFATPFVTGAIALLWSLFPSATVTEIKLAVTTANGKRRTTVVPPLLDAWAAYQFLANALLVKNTH